MLTTLDEIKGHEEQLGQEQLGHSRPQSKAYSRDFSGPNWFDIRRAAAEHADRDPAELVVGGGHAGLSTAASLTQLGIDAPIACPLTAQTAGTGLLRPPPKNARPLARR